MNNTTKIVIGAAAGVALGVVLGVLFAPAKGKETRSKIVEDGKDLADRLIDQLDLKKTCDHCAKHEAA
jgi:gas vesicle protein